MKTFALVVETAILSFLMGGAFLLYAQDKEKERLEAEQRKDEEKPEA